MSALPNAVRKQIDRANKLAEQVSRGAPPTEPPAGEPPAPTPPTSEAPTPPPAAPAAAPVAPPAGEAAPTPPPTPTPAPAIDWEQRYRVLQGKYNAEVPRLQEQAREADRRMRLLEDQLASTQRLLSSLGASPNGASPAQPVAPSKLVKDEEISEFGPDLYDFVQRAARQAVIPDVEARLQQTLKPVAAKVQEVETQVVASSRKVAATEREKVHTLLSEQVPNWLQLNEDPDFLAWLDQTDPYSGSKRGDLLGQAYSRNDGPRVVAFFKGYLTEHAAVTPPPSPTPAAPAAPQVSLERMVAPGAPKQGTAGTQEGAGKRIWTRAEITQFYSDLRAGKYAKRADEAKKMEADIFKAQSEGRIR